MVPFSEESDAVGFGLVFQDVGFSVSFGFATGFLGSLGFFNELWLSYRYGFKSLLKNWKLRDIGFFNLIFQWFWIFLLSVFLRLVVDCVINQLPTQKYHGLSN